MVSTCGGIPVLSRKLRTTWFTILLCYLHLSLFHSIYPPQRQVSPVLWNPNAWVTNCLFIYPQISVSFPSDSDSELEIESEPSTTESSRCHTPLGDYPCVDDSLNLFYQASKSLSKADPAEISTILTTALDNSRDALLAEYSHQELVLLEFITHTPDAANVDDVLLKYPPGFSHACQCAGTVEEEDDLCEVCQLLDAYMDYSFERFQGMDVTGEHLICCARV